MNKHLQYLELHVIFISVVLTDIKYNSGWLYSTGLISGGIYIPGNFVLVTTYQDIMSIIILIKHQYSGGLH